MTEVKSKLNMFTPIIEQRALAGFIKEGHLDHHIYRMKKIYKNRRDLLVNCLVEYFGDKVNIIGDDAGMHIQVEFLADCGNLDWNKAADYGVKVESVQEYSMIKDNNSNRVVLAYGNINNSDIKEGVKRLYNFINKEI
jgi:GntR family transcriptional regulator/MocR family aminotransferase